MHKYIVPIYMRDASGYWLIYGVTTFHLMKLYLYLKNGIINNKLYRFFCEKYHPLRYVIKSYINLLEVDITLYQPVRGWYNFISDERKIFDPYFFQHIIEDGAKCIKSSIWRKLLVKLVSRNSVFVYFEFLFFEFLF